MNGYIQLKKDSIFRLGIKDQNGKIRKDKEGNEVFIEFDSESVDTLVRYNKCIEIMRKAQSIASMKFTAVSKREDQKGKYLLSKNEEEKVNIMKEFYVEIEKAIDTFAGDGATQKIFGNRRYLTMWDDFDEYIRPFLNDIKVNMEGIKDKIKSKYTTVNSDVLSDEELSN